jgi:hypothetical protein
MAAAPAAFTLDEVIAALAAGAPASRVARDIADALLPGRVLDDDRVIGLGWATVDTERTIVDASPLAWEPSSREAAIGASAVTGRIGDVALVVLEPDTEARLAASLARFGEGLCVAYVVGSALGGMVRRTALGHPGRLRAHRHPWGPFVIAVDLPAATIPGA